jgi:hypothetical protein
MGKIGRMRGNFMLPKSTVKDSTQRSRGAKAQRDEYWFKYNIKLSLNRIILLIKWFKVICGAGILPAYEHLTRITYINVMP